MDLYAALRVSKLSKITFEPLPEGCTRVRIKGDGANLTMVCESGMAETFTRLFERCEKEGSLQVMESAK